MSTAFAAPLGVRQEGSRVVVEPLAESHRDGLAEAALDGELFRWMFADLTQRSALDTWLRASLQAGASGLEVPFAVRERASGRIVGSTRFMELRPEHRRVEIGWTWLARSVWGSGVNVETKLLLLGHAIERAGCRRVEFKTDARNERSRGALAALGAQFEGIMRSHMVLADGSSRDSAYFSVIEPEWPRLRERLRQRLALVGG